MHALFSPKICLVPVVPMAFADVDALRRELKAESCEVHEVCMAFCVLVRCEKMYLHRKFVARFAPSAV